VDHYDQQLIADCIAYYQAFDGRELTSDEREGFERMDGEITALFCF
jgi:hypothetical protein